MTPDPLARVRFLFYDQRRCDLAERELLKHPELLIDSSEAHAILGRCAFERGKFEQARSCFCRSLELDPHNTQALFELAVLENHRATRTRLKETRSRHLAEAENLAREIIRLNSYNPSHHALLASILTERRRIREALSAVDKALSINPDDLYSLHVKALALLEWNRCREAIEPLNRALETNPQDAWTHIYLFKAKERSSRAEAQRHLETALRLAPNDRSLRNYCLRCRLTGRQRIVDLIYVVICICFILFLVRQMPLNLIGN
jgi:tetratricopeptide (TPR) repeat protein